MAGETGQATQTAAPVAQQTPGHESGADQTTYWASHANATRQSGMLGGKADQAAAESKALHEQAEQRAAQTAQLEKQVEENDKDLSSNRAATQASEAKIQQLQSDLQTEIKKVKGVKKFTFDKAKLQVAITSAK